MRIALVKPPSNYVATACHIEPLGLAYIGAVCRDAGHEVRIRDVLTSAAGEVEALLAELDGFRPELVGFTAMTEDFKNGLALARVVKQRYGSTVVFGGWHVSGEPSMVLHPAIDFVVRGEGEETMLELLEHLARGVPAVDAIEGLAYQDGGGFCRVNPPRRRSKKLDSLPLPLRDGLPIDRYRFQPLFTIPISRMRTLSVQASRGCPYRCSFCQTPTIWGPAWTRRKPAEVVDEVEHLVDRYRINSLFFRDEEFTVRSKWVIDICEEMVRRGLERRLSWGSFTRADEMSDELAHAMSAAGCGYGFLGLESGDPELRERVQKFYRQEQAEEALRIMRRHGITSHAGWIIGFPDDTREGLERSFHWFQTLALDFLTIVFATPFGSTALMDEVRERGLLLTEDTDLYTTKEPIIRAPAIPIEDLRRLPDHYMRRFYLRPRKVAELVRWTLASPRRWRTLGEMFVEQVFTQHRLTRHGRARAVASPWLSGVEPGLVPTAAH